MVTLDKSPAILQVRVDVPFTYTLTAGHSIVEAFLDLDESDQRAVLRGAAIAVLTGPEVDLPGLLAKINEQATWARLGIGVPR